MAKIGIIIEGLLNPKFKKGGLQGVISILHALTKLGHKSVVFSLWAESVSENDVSELCQDAEFRQIQQPNGKITSDLRPVKNELVEQVSNSGVQCLFLYGFNCIEALKNHTELPSIARIGLPNDRLALARLRIALADSDISPTKRVRTTISHLKSYLVASWRKQGLRKSVDVLIEADLNNARRHSFMARKGYLHFPNPVQDKAIPMSERPLCDNTILFVNAHGTHSLASQLYFTREILPHLDEMEQYDYRIKMIGMDRLPSFINIPQKNAGRIIIQPYTDPLEPELFKSTCLLMCSPLPYGASMRVKTAMMCGTPCVVHSAVTKGLPELVNNQNCLVASEGRIFVEHMRRLLNEPLLRERLSSGARKTYERHFAPGAIIPVLEKALGMIGIR